MDILLCALQRRYSDERERHFKSAFCLLNFTPLKGDIHAYFVLCAIVWNRDLRSSSAYHRGKKHYAAWFAETGFIGVGSHVDLPCISHEDLPNRPDDGSFLGCYNQAWIITEAEAASYERLNHQRQNEKDLAQKAAQDAYNAKIADFETGYENCKKQFESWTVTDVKQKQGDLFAEHTFDLHGKEFSFVERDLHDLGFVINPMYRIDPDSTASGYLTCDDTGAKVWCVNGSRYIPLSEDEALCVNAICQYGKFVNSSIRM